ncbi:MAG: biopolymer transporter ExbD [Bacteroidales bacterium]|jgi:biopolymer transport protein ExbD|nr:biopolymer transporter ExbD [Bacteroidales bacterium]
MAKFRKDVASETPELATTSLPDIIFMLIFFFMVTTSMRQATVMVDQKLPVATEVKKLENKSLVSYIYLGAPHKSYQAKFGTATRIQLNDKFAGVPDIQDFIASERSTKSENDQKLMTTALKVDEKVKMGMVTDVKQALRRVGALKISYTTAKGEKAF